MINCRESNAVLRTAGGARYPIEGYGVLSLTFRSSSGNIPLLLRNLEHVSSLNYHLLALRAVVNKGHTYTSNHVGVIVFFSTRDTLFSPCVGRLNYPYTYRPGMLVEETANTMQLLRLGLRPATVTPPLIPTTFTLPMPMPTRERYARRPSKWTSPSKESCMSARGCQRESACPSQPRRTAAKIRDCLA